MVTQKPKKEERYFAIDMSNGFTYVGREKLDCSIRSLEDVIVMETVSGVNKHPAAVEVTIKNRGGHYARTYKSLFANAKTFNALEYLHDFEHNPNKVAELYLGRDILK